MRSCFPINPACPAGTRASSVAPEERIETVRTRSPRISQRFHVCRTRAVVPVKEDELREDRAVDAPLSSRCRRRCQSGIQRDKDAEHPGPTWRIASTARAPAIPASMALMPNDRLVEHISMPVACAAIDGRGSRSLRGRCDREADSPPARMRASARRGSAGDPLIKKLSGSPNGTAGTSRPMPWPPPVHCSMPLYFARIGTTAPTANVAIARCIVPRRSTGSANRKPAAKLITPETGIAAQCATPAWATRIAVTYAPIA